MLTHRINKVKPLPVQHYGHYAGAKKPPLTQDELVNLHNRLQLSVGDFCTFIRPTENSTLLSDRCVFVAEVCRAIDDLQYDNWGNAKPFLLMGLNGTSQAARSPTWNYNSDPWVRWDQGDSLFVLSDNHRQEVNDDFVQNYIKKHLPLRHQYLGK